ncbi:hypothetical protein GPECTOR_8g260 [Gonium pectorale]|uniref:S1 motif domain-containing protein n=1 Tax=Gonium pectorale TaxID=33097 RepID=A0A150GU61_GONPE|nr:hypothetical protein GPECTOR_8g260 [Gonium pectorale]|eukprot:KXZ52880.1 hypothetical protein GPECTOR_8g260 [Gonium pectorale]
MRTQTTVEEFGAFVDFGSTTNGLVHISKMGAGYTKNVKDVVSVGQKVTVKVLSVDASKSRVSLELKSAANAAAAAPTDAAADEEQVDLIFDQADDAAGAGAEEEEDVEVELEEGQVEVYSDLAGFEDIPFVLDEEDAEELTEAAVAALEADLDNAEIQYELDAPAYLEEVAGKVTRVEDYGAFLEFSWNGKTLTGLLSRDEMKVPSSALSAEAQAALRAEWAETEFEMPQFVELPDDELDVKKYYQPGDEVPAFVLESALVDGRGISLTHFTDEDVAAEAVEAYEALEEEDDEELDKLLEDAAGDIEDEVLAFEPESLLEDDEADAAVGVAAEDTADYTGLDSDMVEAAAGTHDVSVTRSGLIKGKNGFQVAPLGLPSRPLAEAITESGLAILGTAETDFDGDEVQLVEYYNSDLYDNIPKDVLKRIGLKMSFNEQGEAEFTEREGHEDDEDLPLYLFDGDLEARARELVADLLDDDEDEAELPARAGRRPVPL